MTCIQDRMTNSYELYQGAEHLNIDGVLDTIATQQPQQSGADPTCIDGHRAAAKTDVLKNQAFYRAGYEALATAACGGYLQDPAWYAAIWGLRQSQEAFLIARMQAFTAELETCYT